MQKSASLHFGPRYKNACANVMVSGLVANWITSFKYLGVYLESSFTFKCTFATKKRKFYQAFNSSLSFGKIGRIASEVIFALIKSKCLPILLYKSDSCPTNAAVKHSFEFTLKRVLFKIFAPLPKDIYKDICKHFGVDPIEQLISVRQSKFILRYCASEGDMSGDFEATIVQCNILS